MSGIQKKYLKYMCTLLILALVLSSICVWTYVRWITVVLVVLYHVIYMFNGIETFGVIGPFSDVQYQDAFQYIVYPWFMLLLFAVSGMSARYELEHRSEKEFIKKGQEDYWFHPPLGF